MSLRGPTVTFVSSSLEGQDCSDITSMPAGMMIPPRPVHPFSMPLQRINIFSTSGLTLAPPSEVESRCNASQTLESEVMKPREDEFESKSSKSSDNLDGGSAGEDHESERRPSRKRYHRHSIYQIQEMERFFKKCQHPDESQRQSLSSDLNLEPKQVKFWFQNKRTQMKAQYERHDNQSLRSENDKLKSDNLALRDAIRNASCLNCGGPADMSVMRLDEQRLRMENAKLRDEIDRISAIAAKHIGRPFTSLLPIRPNSGVDSTFTACANQLGRPFGLTESEKSAVVELALASMEELMQIAQAVQPLWVLDAVTDTEVIDRTQYLHQFPRGIEPTPSGLKSETSRTRGVVIMNPLAVVENLMDVDRWRETFSYIISRAITVEVISMDLSGTYDGAMQLMYAEFQMPTPLVPARECFFLRYSKRVYDSWVVVDVSLDSLRENPPPVLVRCRKRPSGCIVEELPNGYSNVIWVEHVEVEDKSYGLYQNLVNSGLAFGAQRWVATLKRQSERAACLLAKNIPSREIGVLPTIEGRRSMLKLAERMTNNFCDGVGASTAHTWITLSGTGADDVRVVIRKSIDDPGKPAGVVLSAASSVLLPVPPSKVFDFLRDERFRTQWDILSNTGVVEEVIHVAKGQNHGNSVSLLRVNGINANQSNMLILQECNTDESCSLVIYAPVDTSAMSSVLNGGDPEGVALLPSGFAIFPEVSQYHTSRVPCNAPTGLCSRGSLLTVAFQILVDHAPTSRLSLGSVATVNNLISSTVLRIKNAFVCNDT